MSEKHAKDHAAAMLLGYIKDERDSSAEILGNLLAIAIPDGDSQAMENFGFAAAMCYGVDFRELAKMNGATIGVDGGMIPKFQLVGEAPPVVEMMTRIMSAAVLDDKEMAYDTVKVWTRQFTWDEKATSISFLLQQFYTMYHGKVRVYPEGKK